MASCPVPLVCASTSSTTLLGYANEPVPSIRLEVGGFGFGSAAKHSAANRAAQSPFPLHASRLAEAVEAGLAQLGGGPPSEAPSEAGSDERRSRERRSIVCAMPPGPPALRVSVAEVFFETLEFEHVLLVSRGALALFGQGLTTGLSLDYWEGGKKGAERTERAEGAMVQLLENGYTRAGYGCSRFGKTVYDPYSGAVLGDYEGVEGLVRFAAQGAELEGLNLVVNGSGPRPDIDGLSVVGGGEQVWPGGCILGALLTDDYFVHRHDFAQLGEAALDAKWC